MKLGGLMQVILGFEQRQITLLSIHNSIVVALTFQHLACIRRYGRQNNRASIMYPIHSQLCLTSSCSCSFLLS